MAHIGRPGPYLFRRDLNLNVVNNFQGFFRRYLVQLFNFPPGVASALQGVVFDAGPDTYPSRSEVSWTSPFAGFIPAIGSVRIFAQINTGFDYFKGLEITIKNVGIIYAGHWRASPNSRFPIFPQLEALIVDFYDTNYFDVEPGQLDTVIDLKTWQDGPPH